MREFFFTSLMVFFVLAVLLRADFVFTLLYLFAGALILGRWWSQRALSSLTVQRHFTPRAFLGETIPVELQIVNRGWLPLPWLQVRESLPVELFHGGPFQAATALGPRGHWRLRYLLTAQKRGYYPLGPTQLSSGDVLGLAGTQQWQVAAEHLIVFPKVIPLQQLPLPSHSPLGTLRSRHPIFEDPARVRGKRDYQAGDSLRRVDWKASARTGHLQVKLLEPSISLETVIILNLCTADFDARRRYNLVELAVVIAASLASWVSKRGQAIGLATNGRDARQTEFPPEAHLPRRGQGQLLRLLELLACVQPGESPTLPELVRQVAPRLPWGSTLVVISPRLEEAVFDALFEARRTGLQAVLVQCGPVPRQAELRQRAASFGFPLYSVFEEGDLERLGRSGLSPFSRKVLNG